MAQDKRQVDAITARDVDFAQWFTDVCKKAELIGSKNQLACDQQANFYMEMVDYLKKALITPA